MRRVSYIATAVVLTALSASVAVAQPRGAPPARPNRAAQPVPRDTQQPAAMAQRAQMAQRMGRGPAANMLRMKAQLELTDEQVKRLEALSGANEPRLNQADMMRAQADLMDARKGDVNLDKARAAFDRMARLKTDQQVAQLKVHQDARNVLTAAQKSKVDAFASNMRDRRGQQQMRGRKGGRGGQGQAMPGRRGGNNQGGIRGGIRGGMGPGRGGMPGGMGPGRGGIQGGMGPGRGGIQRGMGPGRNGRPPVDSISQP